MLDISLHVRKESLITLRENEVENITATLLEVTFHGVIVRPAGYAKVIILVTAKATENVYIYTSKTDYTEVFLQIRKDKEKRIDIIKSILV